MVVGVTGTQAGCTPEQLTALVDLLALLHPAELHHGDCIGVDKQAHTIAACNGVPVVIHPPTDAKKRAFCPGYERIEPEKPYLQRNHDIVDAADLLIAVPQTGKEQLRSGTWATVRYATKCRKPIYLVSPSGTVSVRA